MDGFKDTEIGLIPDDWEVKTLGEINIYKQKTLNPLNFVDEEFEYYSIPDYQENSNPSFCKGSKINSNKLLLEEGIILFGKLNPRVEKVWMVGNYSPFRKVGSTEWIPIKPSSEADVNFLYYIEWSDYVMKIAKTKVSGSTPSRQRVDPKSFYNIVIPIPSIKEQKTIAYSLNTIQSLIQKQTQIIENLQELKKALMQKLFTEGLNGEPLKDTEIGKIPESWDVVELSKYLIKTYTRDPKIETEKEIIYIDVSSVSNTIFSIHSYSNYKGKDAPGRARKVVSEGDVIFATVRPTLKRIAIVGKEFENEYCSTAFCVLRTQLEKLNNQYLFYYLQTDNFINEIGKHQSGASYPAVRDTDVKKMKIPYPKLEEQIEIAKIFQSIDNKIYITKEKGTNINSMFTFLLNQLMTGKKRVKDIEI